MLQAVTQDDMKAIVRNLVKSAGGGDVRAAKEIIDRCLGRPVDLDLIERLERLESAMEVNDS